MELSGVRSSWLVLDRKRFFARVAASASSLAAVSSASRRAISLFGPGERVAHAADLVTLRA